MDDPILFVLQQETGTLWKMTEFGVAIEIMLPYRSVVLSRQALAQWYTYQATGHMEPFEFTAEVRYRRHPPPAPTSRIASHSNQFANAGGLRLLAGGLTLPVVVMLTMIIMTIRTPPDN